MAVNSGLLVPSLNPSGHAERLVKKFMNREGVDILVETARMWADLGFWREEGSGRRSFHIHRVTGPDEYTTMVDDNLFTNVMARFNLAKAAELLRQLERELPRAYQRVMARLELVPEEIDDWAAYAESMTIPYDEVTKINSQDSRFLDQEVWDLPNTPPDKRPLLSHHHPLVIYWFQVLKQADVVLALFLQGDHFTEQQKLADFEYTSTRPRWVCPPPQSRDNRWLTAPRS